MAERATLTVQNVMINIDKREFVISQTMTNGYEFRVGDYQFKMISNTLDSEMTQYALDMSILAHVYCTRPVDRASYIAKKFNEKYGVYWQCVIGMFDHYGGVQDCRYITFIMNSVRITLFKGAQE